MSDIKETLEWLEKQSMVIQTLIFPKEKWDSSAAAKKWASSHDFRSGKVDETKVSYRLRQRNPGDFQEGSFRTFCLSPNKKASREECKVTAVGGRLKKEITKAEYPLNSLGMGYRETLENGPYLFPDVEYLEPHENYRYHFCGACAFYVAGHCRALQREVDILGSSKLYIPMDHELMLRHDAHMKKYYAQQEPKAEAEVAKSNDDLEIKEPVEKYIEERDGKFCIISHKTGKNLGCSDTRAEAEKRLERMKRFSKELTVKIASTDDEKRLVYGIVLEADEVDAHEDTISSEEIEKAAHKYALTPMIIGHGHRKEAEARPVETYIYNPEIMKEVKSGSWVMVVKVEDDELWEMVKDGSMKGFSIGAMAKRIPIDELEEEE